MAKYTYKVIFENKTDGEETKAKTTAPTSNGTQPNNAGKSGDSEKLTKGHFLKAMAPIGFAASVVDRFYASRVNTIAIRTGYEERQQKNQFYYGIAKRGINLAKSVAIGAVFGGLPGVALGAVTGAANELVAINIRYNEIGYQRENESTAIFLNQIRMGAGSQREGRTK